MLKNSLKKTVAIMGIAAVLLCSAAFTASAATLYGDANADNTVDVRDVVRMKRHMADSSIEINIEAIDDDESGTVSASDVVKLRKVLLGDAAYDISVVEGEINWPDSWDT